MKKIIILIILIGTALASLTYVAMPAMWSDGKAVKERTKAYYQNMFQ